MVNTMLHGTPVFVALLLALACDVRDPRVVVESSARSGRTTTHFLSIDGEARRVDSVVMDDADVIIVEADAAILAAAVVSDRGVTHFADDEHPTQDLSEELDDATALALELALAGDLPEPAAAAVGFRLMDGGNPFACSYQRMACKFGGGGGVCDLQYHDCMSGM